MKGLIEFIARSLVDKPDDVAVTEIPGERATIYELRVAPDDLGKIIGKNGRTARSMRIILSTASTKAGGKRAVLEIKS